MHQGSMTRLRLTLRVALVAFAVALPVSADAPISGPDRQYENFDGQNKVISDRFTKLAWDRPSDPYPATMSFGDANAYCRAQGSMRLPSLKELLTLIDEEPHKEYDTVKKANVPRYIDRAAFPKTPAEEFWTSSMQSPTKAWTVDFGSGTTAGANIDDDKRRVRCVEFIGL